MTPHPFPERIDEADLERFLELSVREGWPVSKVAEAPFADRHAVLSGLALYLLEATPTAKSDSPVASEALSRAASSFLLGAGSFLKGSPEELLALAAERGFLCENEVNAEAAPGCTAKRLALEVEFAESLRAERREKARAALQKKNRAVNAAPPAVPVADPEADRRFMEQALALAREAAAAGEVPVGAVVVLKDEIVGRGRNATIASHDPTAHAEVEAIRAAARALHNYRLEGATLYVTLEPCPMCTGAIAHARVGRVVFGTADEKAGAMGGALNLLGEAALQRRIAAEGGLMEADCRAVLQAFFRSRR